jgi:hypothetical protein
MNTTSGAAWSQMLVQGFIRQCNMNNRRVCLWHPHQWWFWTTPTATRVFSDTVIGRVLQECKKCISPKALGTLPEDILTKFTVQKANSPVKFSSGSVARRDLIPALKGWKSYDMTYDMIYDMIYDIFNRSWVDTRWQQYITRLQRNGTHNIEKEKLGSSGGFRLFRVIMATEIVTWLFVQPLWRVNM